MKGSLSIAGSRYVWCLVVVFVAAAWVVLMSNALHYHYADFNDDGYAVAVYEAYGIWQGALLMMERVNGRLLSHLLCLALSPVIAGPAWVVVVFYAGNALLFTGSLAYFIGVMARVRYGLSLSLHQVVAVSGFLFAVFFFFYFERRFEYWMWYSALFNYFYSIVAMLLLTGLLLRDSKSWLRLPVVIALSALIGFMAESHAIAQLFILCLLMLRTRSTGFPVSNRLVFVSMVIISACLLLNFFSAGNLRKLSINEIQGAEVNGLMNAWFLFVNDLLFHWGNISIKRLGLHHIYPVVVKAAVIGLLVTIGFLSRGQKSLTGLAANIKGGYLRHLSVVVAASWILLITYAVTAFFYAHTHTVLPDRTKMLGSLAMLLGVIDYAVCIVLGSVRKT